MTDDDTRWTAWKTEVEWPETERPVAPAVKHALEGFLARVLIGVDTLAATLKARRDLDVVAVLADRLERLDAPGVPAVDPIVVMLGAEAAGLADHVAVSNRMKALDDVLAGQPVPVAWVSIALLVERVCRAMAAAGREGQFDEPDDVLMVAATLEGQVREVLGAVARREIAPNTYRVM